MWRSQGKDSRESVQGLCTEVNDLTHSLMRSVGLMYLFYMGSLVLLNMKIFIGHLCSSSSNSSYCLLILMQYIYVCVYIHTYIPICI